MLTRAILGAVIAALLPVAAPAADATSDDLECVAVIGTLVGNAEADKKNEFITGLLYFIGRLDGREPALDLEARLAATALAMSPDDLAAAGTRCGALLTERGAVLEKVGDALTRRGL